MPDKKSTYESYSSLSPDRKQTYEPYSSLGADKKQMYDPYSPLSQDKSNYSPDKSAYSPLSQEKSTYSPLGQEKSNYSPDKSNYSPQKHTYESYSHSLDYKTDKKSSLNDYSAYASPHKSSTLPKSELKSYPASDAFKTDSYRYESSYQQSSPVTTYTSDKYNTAKLYSPSGELKRFEEFTKNGTDHQQQQQQHHVIYSNAEFTSDPVTLTEAQSLEQRMLKQSVTQKVIERQSIQMTSSSKMESSTKSFRFD